MRTVKIVIALLIAVTGSTGCGLFGQGPGQREDEQIQKILDENAAFTVLLRHEITAAQRAEVEAALRALPGASGVTFIDRRTAYQRIKQMYSAETSKAPPFEVENMPESFEITMTDIAAVRKVRDDESAVKNLPGVDELVFTCTTVPECRAKYSPQPSTSPS